MYVDYLSERSILADHGTPEWRSLVKMKRNLEKGMTLCLEIAESEPYPGENLDSIRTTVTRQRARLEEMFEIVVRSEERRVGKECRSGCEKEAERQTGRVSQMA